MNKPLERIAQKGKLSIGLVMPLEAYIGAVPVLENQETLAGLAEEMGFKALWFRDVPFHDPSFGDVGQMYDPWVYMTHIMHHTGQITLATGSIILPLRHPAHIVKSMNSLQNLSGGRFVMGIASGDRPIEYPAFGQSIAEKASLFRDSFEYIQALSGRFPRYKSEYYGEVNGAIDLLPKSTVQTPLLVTGHSGQSLDWIAEHGDGWLYYPRNHSSLHQIMSDWQNALSRAGSDWKPYMQSLYLDFIYDAHPEPTPIHLGFRAGIDYTLHYLKELESIGVNHVIINLKFSSRPVEQVIRQLGEHVLPHFR